LAACPFATCYGVDHILFEGVAMLMRVVLAGLFAALTLMSWPAHSQPMPSDLVAALRAGGYVIVFRHGATFTDQADTDPLHPDNVAQQRQLNDKGRAEARAIGEALRKLQIPVGQVITSAFNRAVETGKLIGSGNVTATLDVTEGGLVVSPNENNRRMQALRKLAATVPPPGTNVVIVSHKPNILDAFGKDWFEVREGEASVFKPDGSGYKLIARLQAEQWPKLAVSNQ
jgi:phosphohistidine phosphatase SixA